MYSCSSTNVFVIVLGPFLSISSCPLEVTFIAMDSIKEQDSVPTLTLLHTQNLVRKATKMGRFVFTAAVVTVFLCMHGVTARVAHVSLEGSGSEILPENELDIDLGEWAVEFFRDGTQKNETLEKLVDIYRMALNEKNFVEKYSDAGPEDASDRARRTIFGTDDRLPVYNTNISPYCAVGRLDNGCTAVFIGPYHAITAAHCVYDKNTNTWKQNLNMWRGRTCGTCGERMYWRRVWAVQGFTQQHRIDYDYALIIYDENNRSPCWLSFGYKSSWPNIGFDIFGYPYDKAHVSGCSYNSMWFSSCHYSHTQNSGRRYGYHCDTLGGNSGSALYAEDDVTAGTRRVYGIHTHGRGTSTWNYGNRIDKFRFCQIIEWMDDSGYRPLCTTSPCCSSSAGESAAADSCFPPYATVRTANSSTTVKTMKELNIGDKVLAVTSEGELVYSPVIAFSEWSPRNKEKFVKLETEHGHVLTVTPVHVVFRSQFGNSSNEAAFASEIKPGDFLLTTDEFFSSKDKKDTVRMSKVTKTSIIRAVGTYAPVTSEGTLIVDGVATSCYGVVKNHDLIHFFFAPLRLINYFFPRVVGSEQEGTHWYSRFLLTMGEYVSPYLFSKEELYHAY